MAVEGGGVEILLGNFGGAIRGGRIEANQVEGFE